MNILAEAVDPVVVGLEKGRQKRANEQREFLRQYPLSPVWWAVQDELDCTADEARAACRVRGYDSETGRPVGDRWPEGE